MYSTSYSTLYVEVTRALGTHYNTRWPRPPNIGIEEKGFRECFEKLIAQSLPRHQIRLYLKRRGSASAAFEPRRNRNARSSRPIAPSNYLPNTLQILPEILTAG